MRTLKDQVCIVGVGHTEYSRGSRRSEMRLACEALRISNLIDIAPEQVVMHLPAAVTFVPPPHGCKLPQFRPVQQE